jgi:hypothetical protein
MFGVLASGIAAMQSSAQDAGSKDALLTGTSWKGECFQDGRAFGITIRVTERKGDDIKGEIVLNSRDGRSGSLSFDGMIQDSKYVSWITKKESGDVTSPGLYSGKLSGNDLSGVWRVPSYQQRDKFTVTKQ